MVGFVKDIESLTVKNKYFRHVLFTGKYAQLVVMSLKPGEDIGDEVHKTVDQFFRIESGQARFVFNEKEVHNVKAGAGVLIPAGTWHNVINTGKKDLKLYTIYSPPNHPDGVIRKTKADAMKHE